MLKVQRFACGSEDVTQYNIRTDVIKHFSIVTSRHAALTVVHWAYNETAPVEIFPNAHQRQWLYIVCRLVNKFAQDCINEVITI